jgi:hypothetical protein
VSRLVSTLYPARALLTLLLAAFLCSTLLSGASIGKSIPPPPVNARPHRHSCGKGPRPLAQYLDRSERQNRSERAFLDAELKSAGLARPTVPPSGSAARSIALDRSANWYATPDVLRIARIVVPFQTPAGGWSKNLNMADHEHRPGEHLAGNNISCYLAPGDFDTAHDAARNFVHPR